MAGITKIHRAVKYRIHPTAEQQDLLAQTFGCARKVYNMGLEMLNGLHEAEMPYISPDSIAQSGEQEIVMSRESPPLRRLLEEAGLL